MIKYLRKLELFQLVEFKIPDVEKCTGSWYDGILADGGDQIAEYL